MTDIVRCAVCGEQGPCSNWVRLHAFQARETDGRIDYRHAIAWFCARCWKGQALRMVDLLRPQLDEPPPSAPKEGE